MTNYYDPNLEAEGASRGYQDVPPPPPSAVEYTDPNLEAEAAPRPLPRPELAPQPRISEQVSPNQELLRQAAQGLEELEAAPRIPITEQLLGGLDPALAMEQNTVATLQQQALRQIDDFIGPSLEIGPLMKGQIEQAASVMNTDRVQDIDLVANMPPEQFFQSVSEEVYRAMPEQDKSRFIGIAAMMADGIGGPFKAAFDRRIQAGEEERIFSTVLQAYIDQPKLIVPELQDYFDVLGIVKPAPNRFDVSLDVLGGGPVKDLSDAVQKRVNIALTPEYSSKLTDMLNADDIYGDVTVDDRDRWNALADSGKLVETAFREYDHQYHAEATKFAAAVERLRVEVPGSVATQFTPSQLYEISQIYPSLARLSAEDLVKALAVNAGDVDVTRIVSEQRLAAGVASNAEKMWLGMGLSVDQIRDLTSLIALGPKQVDLVGTQLNEYNKAGEQARDKLRAWIAANPGRANEVPSQLVVREFVTRDYLMSLGVGMERAVALTKRSSSVLESSLRTTGHALGVAAQPAVWVLGKAGDLAGDVVGAFVDLSALSDDHYADVHGSDPNTPIGFTFTSTGGPNFGGAVGDNAREIYVGLNSLLEGVVPGKDKNSYEGDWGGRNIDPRHKAGGQVRNDFSKIWVGATDEERELIADSFPAMAELVEGDDGVWRFAGMQAFNDLVLRDGTDISTAAQAVLRARVWRAVGSDASNLISAAAGKVVQSGRLAKISRLSTSNYANIRSGAKIVPASITDDTVDLLNQRLVQIRSMRDTGMRPAATWLDDTQLAAAKLRLKASPAARELTPEIAAKMRATTDSLSPNEILKLQEEADEIVRVLNAVDAGVETTVGTTIRFPSNGGDALMTWDMLNNSKVRKAWERVNEPFGQFSRTNPEKFVALTDSFPSRITAQIRATGFDPVYLFRQTFVGRTAAANVDALQAERAVETMFGSIYNKAGELDHAGQARRFVTEFKTAASQGRANLIRWLRANNFGNTRDYVQAGDFLNNAEVDKMVTLAPGVKVAKDSGDYERLLSDTRESYLRTHKVRDISQLKPAQKNELTNQLSLIYRNPEQWQAEFQVEMLENLGHGARVAYGVTGDAPLAARIQGRISSAQSRVFLSYPGFAVRNLMSNFAAAAMDGIDPIKLIVSKKHREQWDRFLQTQPPAIGISFVTSPTDTLTALAGQRNRARSVRDIAEQARSFRKSARHRGVLGGAMGDGIPGLGGVPFLSMRGASSYFEAWSRGKITTYEFARWMRQTSPALATRFDEIAKTTGAFDVVTARPELRQSIVNAILDPSFTDVAAIRGSIIDSGVDDFFLVPRVTAEDLAQRLGVNPGTLLPEQWAGMTEIMNDPLLSGRAAANRMDDWLQMIEDEGLARASAHGVPDEVHREVMQLADDMWNAALQAEVPAPVANWMANTITGQMTKRMDFVYSFEREVLDYLNDPDFYQSSQFGLIKMLNDKAIGPDARQLIEELEMTKDENMWRFYRVNDDVPPRHAGKDWMTTDVNKALRYAKGDTGRIKYVDIDPEQLTNFQRAGYVTKSGNEVVWQIPIEATQQQQVRNLGGLTEEVRDLKTEYERQLARVADKDMAQVPMVRQNWAAVESAQTGPVSVVGFRQEGPVRVLDRGVFYAADPQLAQQYARGEAALRVDRLNFNNALVVDGYKEEALSALGLDPSIAKGAATDPAADRAITKAAKEQGYDGVILREARDDAPINVSEIIDLRDRVARNASGLQTSKSFEIRGFDTAVNDMLVDGVTKETRTETLQAFADEASVVNNRVIDNVLDAARVPVNGQVNNDLIRLGESARLKLRQLRREVGRYENTRISRPTKGVIPVDAADLATRGIWTPDPTWTKARRAEELDKAIDKVARLVPQDFKFVVRPQGSKLMAMFGDTVTEGELRRAVGQSIKKGEVQKKWFTNKGRASVTRSDVLDSKMSKKQLDDLTQELGRELDQYTQALSQWIVSNNAPNITRFSARQRVLTRQMSNDIRKMVTERIGAGYPGTDMKVHVANIIQEAEYRIQKFSDEFVDEFNELGDGLFLQPLSKIERDMAPALGKWAPDSAPNEYTRWVLENAPYRQTMRRMRPDIAKLKNEKAAIWTDAPTFDDTLDVTEAVEWAKAPVTRNVDSRGLYYGRESSDDISVLDITGVADDVKVLPATHGLGTPPAGYAFGTTSQGRGVHGFNFYRKAPKGWKTMITGDEYGASANRMAIYVRDDATRDEILDAATKMKQAHRRAVGDKKLQAQLKELGITPNSRQQNPLGYHSSIHVETEADVTRDLAKYVRMVENAEPDHEVAARVLAYAKKQRDEGWPITGGKKRAYLTDEEKALPDFRTMDDVFNNFKGAMRQEELSRGAVRLSKKEASALDAAVVKLAREKEAAVRFGYEAGAARADWVLHNYANTNDLDFLLSFISPWHIWPTRTVAKLSARIANNPTTMVGVTAYLNALDKLHGNLPPELDYLRERIPVANWAANPMASFGMADKNSTGTLDPSGTMFWLGFLDTPSISDFSPEGEKEFTAVGRAMDKLDRFGGPIGFSPVLTGLASVTGQFGEQDFLTRGPISTQIRRGNTQLGVLSDIVEKFTGFRFPRYLVMTDRDLNNVNRQFGIEVIRAIDEGGPTDNARLTELLDGWERWASRDKLGFAEQILADGAAGVSGDIVDEVVSNSRKNEMFRIISATTLGAQIALRAEEMDEIEAFLDEYFKLNEVDFDNDGQRARAYEEFLTKNPWVQRYLDGFAADGSNAPEYAKNEWFAQLGAIKDNYNRAVQERGLAFPQTPEQAIEADNLAVERERAEQAALAAVVEKYGIDPAIFEKAHWTLSKPEFEEYLRAYEGLSDSDVEDMTTIQRISNEKFTQRTLTPAEVEELMRDPTVSGILARAPHLRQLQFVNRHMLSDQLSLEVLKYKSEVDPQNFRINKGGFGLTNAIDWPAYFAFKADYDSKMATPRLRAIQNVQTMNLDVTTSIQNGIEEIIQNEFFGKMSEIAAEEEDSVRQSQRITELLNGFGEVRAIDVYNTMMEMYGDLWRINHDLTDEQMLEQIQGVLDNMDPNLEAMINSNIERKIQVMTNDLRRQEAGEDVEVRHVKMPSGFVLTSQADIDAAQGAIALNKVVTDLYDKGIRSGFISPTTSDQTEAWYRMFRKNGETKIARQQIIDSLFAQDSTNSKNLAFELIEYWGELDKGNNTESFEGSASSPTDSNSSGSAPTVRSSGNLTTRTTGYVVDYVSPTAPLSREGQLTKNFLISKYFTGQYAENAPPDYVFEHLARNGVAAPEEISDYFWSVFNASKDAFGPAFAANQDVSDLLFAFANEEKDDFTGEPRVATFRYLNGINGLLDTIFNMPTRKQKANTSSSNNTNPLVHKALTNTSGAQPRRTTSRAGTGGLPTWSEATDFITNVFHSDDLSVGLHKYFTQRGYKFSRTEQMQLKYMFRFFDVGIDVSYDEWLETLKLMWQTSSLQGQGPTRTRINPADRGFSKQPRIARYTRE